MFSATIPDTIRQLCQNLLSQDHLSISFSASNSNQPHLVLNSKIKQSFNIIESNDVKWSWLTGGFLQQRLAVGSVIIFVTRIEAVKLLSQSLNTSGFPCCLIHGDMTQSKFQDFTFNIFKI